MKIYGNDGKILFGDKKVEIVNQNGNILDIKIENGDIYTIEVTGSNTNEVYANIVKVHYKPIKIGDNFYNVVKVGDYFWTTENFHENVGVYQINSDYKFGYAYALNSLCDVNDEGTEWVLKENIKAIVPDGWNIASKNEFDNLFNAAGKNTNEKIRNLMEVGSFTDGVDKFGVGLTPCGYYDGSWSGVGTAASYNSRTKTNTGSTLNRLTIQKSDWNWNAGGSAGVSRLVRFCKPA